MKTARKIASIVALAALLAPAGSWAKGEVSTIIAARGKSYIEREGKTLQARVKDDVLIVDTLSTMEASRMRMLFRDDGVLTLGEKTRLSVSEYVYTKGKGGKSVLNLIDGKLRAVVGRTDFEVRTPTAVAAARGTVILIETGTRNGKPFTTIVCLEGEVVVTPLAGSSGSRAGGGPGGAGGTILSAGMAVTVFANEPIPIPAPPAPGELARLNAETDAGRQELPVLDPSQAGELMAGAPPPAGGLGETEESSLPAAHIEQQPPRTTGMTAIGAQITFP